MSLSEQYCEYPGRRGAFAVNAGNPLPPAPEWGPQAVVTWESARPIRDAFKTALPYMFANSYAIGVDGIPLGNSLNLDYLRQFAVLHSKGRQKWAVRATVVHELVRNSAICVFGFSRADAPIDADTEEVVFETDFGRYMVQAKFRPKDMLYRGELAL